MLDPRYETFLTELGAKEIRHSGRTLFEHLKGTHDILEGWKAPPFVATAGLFHSIYGTEYFKHACLPLCNRPVLRRLIGPEAEELAYTFCTSPRKELLGWGLTAIASANQLEQEFARCWPWLEESLAFCAFEKDGKKWLSHNKEHVLERVVTGKSRFWPGKKCAWITEVHTSPTGLKSHHIWLTGGDLDEIKSMEPMIADWGRQRGCHRQTGNGREGWLKAFEGYYKIGVRKAKDL